MLSAIEIILIAFLSGSTVMIGVALACFLRSRAAISTGIGFSAGIMIALSFFELLRTSAQLIAPIFVVFAFALGALLIGIFDLLFPHLHITEEKGRIGALIKISYLVAFGLIIHDFPEGFAIASAAKAGLGFITVASVALHNIPEGLALSLPLILAGKRHILVRLLMLSVLAGPLGAALGLGLISVASALNPILMAFAAGAMVFVVFDELAPLARAYKGVAPFALGLLTGISVWLILTALV
jgi:ZIP family zinc transporter